MRSSRTRTVTVFRVATNPYARATPFAAIGDLVRATLSVDPVADAPTAGNQLLAELTRVAPDLVVWAPLIATVIGASVPATAEVERLAPEHEAERLVRTTVDALLAVGADPALLVVEDLHWADEASIAVLAGLSARVVDTHWMVCTTRRPGVEWTDDAFELPLGPIDASAAYELLAAAVGEQGITDRVAASMVARAQGNPLFLRELVAVAGEGDLPETVEQVIGAQIDALPPARRQHLRDAAVGGATVDLALLADACAAPEPARPADLGAAGRLRRRWARGSSGSVTTSCA